MTGFESYHFNTNEGQSPCNLRLGAGNDSFTGWGGRKSLLMGAGDDTIYDFMTAGVLRGQGGDDAFDVMIEGFQTRTPGQATILSGGAGQDSLYAWLAVADLTIERGRGDYLRIPMLSDGSNVIVSGFEDITFQFGGQTLTYTGNNRAEKIVGSSVQVTVDLGGGEDQVLRGPSAGDQLSGGDGDDRLLGGEGQDTLDGGLAGDRLFGGLGNDWMIGGAGVDWMVGGEGKDVFVFGATLDSGPAIGQIDNIIGFEIGTGGAGHVDRIDLRAIDGDPQDPGDDPLIFIGQAALTGVGQVRVQQLAGGVYVLINTDADLLPDMRISLPDCDASLLEAADFML